MYTCLTVLSLFLSAPPLISKMPAGAIPFPFGKCRICNDKATGVHYGIATCEGCKVGDILRSLLAVQVVRPKKKSCLFPVTLP